MATSETISFNYVTSDGKSLTLSYDPSGNVLVSATMQVDGQFFQWATVEDFKDFLSNAVAMVNVMHSPSGSGTGYVPATVGTDGSDAIVD